MSEIVQTCPRCHTQLAVRTGWLDGPNRLLAVMESLVALHAQLCTEGRTP